MELETLILKNVGDIKGSIADSKGKIDAEHQQARKKIEEQFMGTIKLMEQKFDAMAGQMALLLEDREKDKAALEKIEKLSQVTPLTEAELDTKVDKSEKKLIKEVDDLK